MRAEKEMLNILERKFYEYDVLMENLSTMLLKVERTYTSLGNPPHVQVLVQGNWGGA